MLDMKTPKITEKEIGIIKDAQAGSIQAFNRIFYMYKDFVEKLLCTYIKDMDESKDLANIVFLKVYDKLSTFKDYSSFGGWLRILTKNTAIDYLRTVKSDNVSTDDENRRLEPSISLDPESVIVANMTFQYIVEQIDKLPPSYRDVCKLFYINNLTVEQISDSLNMPLGTVKSQLHRARKLFKKFKL